MDGICREVHPTARAEVLAGTVREVFTNYIAENGCQIMIVGQPSVNNSVQFLGLSDQAWGSGLPFISNLLVYIKTTWWGSYNNSNQKWGGHFKDANIITNVTWGASVEASPANLPRSTGHPRAARHCVRDDFLCRRRQKHLWRQYNWRNPLVNTRFFRQGQNRDGSITQSFQIFVASVSNFFQIACKIALCATCSCCV